MGVAMKRRLLISMAVLAALVLAGTAVAAKLDVIRGTPHADDLQGTANGDLIYARAGDDNVMGLGGNDVVWGGYGRDTLHGNEGNDTQYGGPGNDTVRGGDDNDVVYGGPGDDTIWGGRGADQEYGGPGNDSLHSLADDNAPDLLNCGEGNDSAFVNARKYNAGLETVRRCERVVLVQPTPDQTAQDEQG